jgi:hypothetical protein
MLMHVKRKREEMEEYNMDYKVVEMQEIINTIPGFEKFVQEMSYLQDLDLGLVYDTYKEVFMSDKVSVPDFGDNTRSKN